jgi:hypothetical protein
MERIGYGQMLMKALRNVTLPCELTSQRTVRANVRKSETVTAV